MAVRTAPFWLDRVPKGRRRSYSRYKGDSDTAVAIVGGGLTGCACAQAFAAAGVKVTLLEADAIAGGDTARGTGLVREDFDASFRDTASRHGLRAARTLWQGMRRGSMDMASALKRLGIKCDLLPQDILRVARREPADAKELRREYDARREAGFDHSWLTAAAVTRDAAIDSGGAIRTRGSALDPYRAAIGLAAAAASRGAAIHERSTVRRIRAGRRHVDITTDAGVIHADTVIVATSAPIRDLRALRRHLHVDDAYAVVTEPLPAGMRREVGRRATAIRDGASPPHLLRWLKDDRILFAGGDRAELPARARDRNLMPAAWELMYELSLIYPAISGLQPAWAWDMRRYHTADGLPCIGPHRNFPRHLFAIGEGRHGAAVSWLAARVLLRAYRGEPDKGDEAFGFARLL